MSMFCLFIKIMHVVPSILLFKCTSLKIQQVKHKPSKHVEAYCSYCGVFLYVMRETAVLYVKLASRYQ